MNEMQLKAILKEVGNETQAAGPLRMQAIRAQARRHVRRQRITGAICAIAICAATVAWLTHHEPKVAPPIVETVPELPAYLATADAMRAHIREEARAQLDRRRVAAALAAGELINIDDAREMAARTMVTTAPRRGELAGAQEAAAVYRRTIDLFPETHSARQARTALDLLHLQN